MKKGEGKMKTIKLLGKKILLAILAAMCFVCFVLAWGIMGGNNIRLFAETIYYTADVSSMPTHDFVEAGLVSDAKTGVYTETGLKEFYDSTAFGTTLDTTFTASFMFKEGAEVNFPISFRRSGWAEDQKINIYPTGKVELCKSRGPAAETFNGEEFIAGKWYYLKYTVANIYMDEKLENHAGYRMLVSISDKAEYSGEYSLDLTNAELAATDLAYNTGNFFLWVGTELSGHFGVASYQYNPSADPEPIEPVDPDADYTKAIEDMPEIDFLSVGLITDPYADVYTETGLKEFYEANAPGTTLDTTFTASFMFKGGADVNFPISFRRSGWNEGLKLNIYSDGKVWLYKADTDNAENRKEFKDEAFEPDTWYYLKYTVANLYSDQKLTQKIGYRSTVTITDNADYNITYTYSFTFEETGNTVYDTGNFFVWVGTELGTHFGIASYRYNPSAKPVEYYPAVDIDEAEIIEISEKIGMNANGFSLASYTQEADGYYANFSQDLGNGVYEMNKTLRYKFRGSGSFHTAYAGNWIWNGYKVDVDYTKNEIVIGLGSSNTETLKPTPALNTDTVYLVEITIIEYFRTDNDEKAYEMFYVRIYVDGEKQPFVDKSYQYVNPIIPESGARDYVGFYMGLTGNTLNILPVEFSRNYAVTLINGNNNNQVAVSYSETYDFTQYVTEQKGYEFEGWEYYDDGTRNIVPSTGIWTVDFTTMTEGIYIGTLTARYVPVEYTVNYVVAGGTNSSNNPSTINVENGVVTLSAAEPANEGEVFFGWYLNSEFIGNPVEKIECTYQEITLYAKIAAGCTITLILPGCGQYSVSVETNTTFTFPTETSEGYGEITGWQVRAGNDWTNVNGMSVTVNENSVYRAVAQPIVYTISYELGDGECDEDNPVSYTIEDSVTFVNPIREGYFFIGWYLDDEMIKGIITGTTGNISVEARWTKNTIPVTATYTVRENAVMLPVPENLPVGSHYKVMLYDAQDNVLEIDSNTYIFNRAGSYKLVYSLTLPSGIYTHETQITVTEKTDTSSSDSGTEETPSGGCNGCNGTLSAIPVVLVAMAAVTVLIVRKRLTEG